MVTALSELPPTRTTEPGAPLRLLVLVAGPGHCTGVDLASGALVRSHWAPGDDEAPLGRYEVATAVIAEEDVPPDPACPEAVAFQAPPEPGRRLRRGLVRRYLEHLQAPSHLPLLGFPGPAIAYWEVPGTHPSLALIIPTRGPQVVVDEDGGVRARFEWANLDHVFPLTDPEATALVLDSDRARLPAEALTSVLGYRVRYVLMALSGPEGGQCHKTVAALLPAGP
ncbi:MAG TPA: hypothetical protein VE152_09745 [Acidimicrobiales bacterium]|nr:hypothetical protein [Acidimicrobiales bacterium]